jgi:deoxyribonuclease-4
MKIVVHGNYTINFAHPPKSSQFTKSIKLIVNDMNIASHFHDKCLGVIIHMGRNIESNDISDKKAMQNYVIGIKKVLNLTPSNTTLILETGASQGTEIGSSMEDLSEIYLSLTKNEKKRIKFCIDTCHIWATGYDISSTKKVSNFFKLFDLLIGVEKIACIHFNDSKTPLSSCVDRHEDLCYGKIGKNGLKSIAKYAYKNKIPMIMETPLTAIHKNPNESSYEKITNESEIKKIKKWIF